MPDRSRILNAGVTMKLAPAPFHPTIIMGLGGTGKEVLLKLRKKFYEKYGKPDLPAIGYLWIDTDLRDISLDGQKIEYMANELMLQPTEIIDAQISKEGFAKYFKNKVSYPNIFRWMEPAIESHGSVFDGTKAFRPLGRLGLFHAFEGENGIEKRLLSHNQNIQSQNVQIEMQDFAKIDTTKINVYIISSIAGGTGGGMLLDMAFLAKDIIKNANICGFVVLPSLFTDDTDDRRYANGYAALKELEFYSQRRGLNSHPMSDHNEKTSFNEFEVEWRRGDKKSIQGPPFDTCYLIDNNTIQGGSIKPEQKIEFCDMIAESIFMDLSPDTDMFAAQKRMIPHNLMPTVLNDIAYEYVDSKDNVVHSEIMSCRFSAFGCSKIYMPMARIINACSYKLGEDLVDLWLSENALSDDIKEEIRRNTLSKLGLVAQNVADSNIFDELSKINDTGDKIAESINQWISEEEHHCQDRVKSKTRDLQSYISAEYNECLRRYYNGDKDTEGQFVKRIKTVNKDVIMRKMQNEIWKMIAEMIGDRNIRLDLATKNLGQVCRILDENIKKFNDDRNNSESEANKLSQKFDGYLQIIGKSEKSFLYRKKTLAAYVTHTFDTAKSYLNMRARMTIDETASQICEELKNFIGSETETSDIKAENGVIIAELREFREQLNTLKSRLHGNFELYDKPESSSIYINLYKEGDFGDFYCINEQPVNNEILASLDKEFLISAKIGGLLDFRPKFSNPGIEYVEGLVAEFCAVKFAELKSGSKVDALKRFMKQNADEEQRNQMVRKFYTMGSGWLKQGSHFMGNGITENIKSMAYLGIAGKQDDEYGDFVRLFKSISNTEDRINVEKSLICYYSEHAGIPLIYINGLDEYRKCYQKMADKSDSGLHIECSDKHYPDLLLKTDVDIATLREASRILLTSTILGIISVSEDAEKHEYKYMRTDTDALSLGSESNAIEMIKSDFELRSELDHEVTDIAGELDKLKRIQYYAVLDYYTNELFRPTFYKVGNIIEERRTFENTSLTAIQGEIRKSLLPAISERDFNKQVAEAKKNINDFSVIIGDKRIFRR